MEGNLSGPISSTRAASGKNSRACFWNSNLLLVCIVVYLIVEPNVVVSHPPLADWLHHHVERSRLRGLT